VSERRAFDYVIVQVVPRVDRDERLNVGVILFCPAAAWLGCRFALDEARLRAFAPSLDLAAVKNHLEAIRAVCVGEPAAGEIAALTASERFHWLSAARSTVIQTGPGHVGLCDDPAAALERIFDAAVGVPTSST
jgi:Protein of unknown function (DUF3037)